MVTSYNSICLSTNPWNSNASVLEGNEEEGKCELRIQYPVDSVCLQCRRPGFNPWLGRSPGEGNGNPLQCSCLENSMDRGAWWATVHTMLQSDMNEWLSRYFITLHYERFKSLSSSCGVFIQNSNIRKLHQMQKQKENEFKELQMVISWNC